jgi:hypothetical protein
MPRGIKSSWAKADDILAPPDTQSSPFIKAGLKVVGAGAGAYGELDGWLDWPAELYANERLSLIERLADFQGRNSTLRGRSRQFIPRMNGYAQKV